MVLGMRHVLLCVLLSSVPASLVPCSRIFWNDNSIARVTARSMDLYIDEHPMLAVCPPGIAKNGDAPGTPLSWKSKYASIVVTAFEKAISDGMNDQGLAAHVLYLHQSAYEARDNRPGLSNAHWVEYVLDNFATVDEVVKEATRFQIVSTRVHGREWPLHLAIEDRSGDSAIFEFLEGKLVIHHGPQVTVMTNDPPYSVQLANLKNYRSFGGTLALPGDSDSESRFVRASAFLKTLRKPETYLEAVSFLLGAIRPCQVPFGAEKYIGHEEDIAWPTRWVTVADMTNGVYYFNATVIPNIAWIDLSRLRPQAGSPVRELNLYDPNVEGEVSSLLHAAGAH